MSELQRFNLSNIKGMNSSNFAHASNEASEVINLKPTENGLECRNEKREVLSKGVFALIDGQEVYYKYVKFFGGYGYQLSYYKPNSVSYYANSMHIDYFFRKSIFDGDKFFYFRIYLYPYAGGDAIQYIMGDNFSNLTNLGYAEGFAVGLQYIPINISCGQLFGDNQISGKLSIFTFWKDVDNSQDKFKILSINSFLEISKLELSSTLSYFANNKIIGNPLLIDTYGYRNPLYQSYGIQPSFDRYLFFIKTDDTVKGYFHLWIFQTIDDWANYSDTLITAPLPTGWALTTNYEEKVNMTAEDIIFDTSSNPDYIIVYLAIRNDGGYNYYLKLKINFQNLRVWDGTAWGSPLGTEVEILSYLRETYVTDDEKNYDLLFLNDCLVEASKNKLRVLNKDNFTILYQEDVVDFNMDNPYEKLPLFKMDYINGAINEFLFGDGKKFFACAYDSTNGFLKKVVKHNNDGLTGSYFWKQSQPIALDSSILLYDYSGLTTYDVMKEGINLAFQNFSFPVGLFNNGEIVFFDDANKNFIKSNNIVTDGITKVMPLKYRDLFVVNQDGIGKVVGLRNSVYFLKSKGAFNVKDKDSLVWKFDPNLRFFENAYLHKKPTNADFGFNALAVDGNIQSIWGVKGDDFGITNEQFLFYADANSGAGSYSVSMVDEDYSVNGGTNGGTNVLANCRYYGRWFLDTSNNLLDFLVANSIANFPNSTKIWSWGDSSQKKIIIARTTTDELKFYVNATNNIPQKKISFSFLDFYPAHIVEISGVIYIDLLVLRGSEVDRLLITIASDDTVTTGNYIKIKDLSSSDSFTKIVAPENEFSNQSSFWNYNAFWCWNLNKAQEFLFTANFENEDFSYTKIETGALVTKEQIPDFSTDGIQDIAMTKDRSFHKLNSHLRVPFRPIYNELYPTNNYIEEIVLDSSADPNDYKHAFFTTPILPHSFTELDTSQTVWLDAYHSGNVYRQWQLTILPPPMIETSVDSAYLLRQDTDEKMQVYFDYIAGATDKQPHRFPLTAQGLPTNVEIDAYGASVIHNFDKMSEYGISKKSDGTQLHDITGGYFEFLDVDGNDTTRYWDTMVINGYMAITRGVDYSTLKTGIIRSTSTLGIVANRRYSVEFEIFLVPETDTTTPIIPTFNFYVVKGADTYIISESLVKVDSTWHTYQFDFFADSEDISLMWEFISQQPQAGSDSMDLFHKLRNIKISEYSRFTDEISGQSIQWFKWSGEEIQDYVDYSGVTCLASYVNNAVYFTTGGILFVDKGYSLVVERPTAISALNYGVVVLGAKGTFIAEGILGGSLRGKQIFSGGYDSKDGSNALASYGNIAMFFASHSLQFFDGSRVRDVGLNIVDYLIQDGSQEIFIAYSPKHEAFITNVKMAKDFSINLGDNTRDVTINSVGFALFLVERGAWTIYAYNDTNKSFGFANYNTNLDQVIADTGDGISVLEVEDYETTGFGEKILTVLTTRDMSLGNVEFMKKLKRIFVDYYTINKQDKDALPDYFELVILPAFNSRVTSSLNAEKIIKYQIDLSNVVSNNLTIPINKNIYDCAISIKFCNTKSNSGIIKIAKPVLKDFVLEVERKQLRKRNRRF